MIWKTISHYRILEAQLYALLGDKDRAFEWIQIAFETDVITDLKTNLFYGSPRSDPRYAEWLRHIRLG